MRPVYILSSYDPPAMQFDLLVKFLSLLLLIAIQSLAQSQGTDEEWTDISGKKTVIAEFIRLDGVQLILRKADGKELVIPLNKLDDKSRIKARAIAKSSMKKGEAKIPREAANSVAFSQQPNEVTNSIGMRLVLIHAGSFTMGCDRRLKGSHFRRFSGSQLRWLVS